MAAMGHFDPFPPPRPNFALFSAQVIEGCPLGAGTEALSPVWGIFAHTERLSVIDCSAPIPARDGTAKVDPLEGRAARLGASAGSTGF